MENIKRYENDPGEKGRSFYFTAKGIFQAINDLLEIDKKELVYLKKEALYFEKEKDNLRIKELEERIKRYEVQKEVLSFVHKCTFD